MSINKHDRESGVGRDIRKIGLEHGELGLTIGEQPSDSTFKIGGEIINNVYRILMDIDVKLNKNFLLVYFFNIPDSGEQRGIIDRDEFRSRRVFEIQGGLNGEIVGEVFTKEGESYRNAPDRANVDSLDIMGPGEILTRVIEYGKFTMQEIAKSFDALGEFMLTMMPGVEEYARAMEEIWVTIDGYTGPKKRWIKGQWEGVRFDSQGAGSKKPSRRGMALHRQARRTP